MQPSSGHAISLRSSVSSDSGSSIHTVRPVKKKPRFYDPEIPYYDAELDVAQSYAHKDVIAYLLPLMQSIGKDQGLRSLSDNPIWYKEVPPEERNIRYADLALARKTPHARINARDLLLVLEVVTSSHPAKLQKDTVLQRQLNEEHRVPEFGLIWPEMDDTQTLNLFRLDPHSGTYQEVAPDEQGHIRSLSIPGLSFVIQPRESWEPGQKVVAYYQGDLHHTADRAKALRLEAEERAHNEARERQLADERAASEAHERQLADERADKEAHERQLERERADKEARERQLADERADKEAHERQLERDRADKEARERQLERERADKEARERQLERERADKEARERQLADERADKEARERQLADERTAKAEAEADRFRELLRSLGVDPTN